MRLRQCAHENRSRHHKLANEADHAKLHNTRYEHVKESAKKFTPHLLNKEQKKNHISVCQDLQDKHQKDTIPSVTLSFSQNSSWKWRREAILKTL
jgi:hypothetical protein